MATQGASIEALAAELATNKDLAAKRMRFTRRAAVTVAISQDADGLPESTLCHYVDTPEEKVSFVWKFLALVQDLDVMDGLRAVVYSDPAFVVFDTHDVAQVGFALQTDAEVTAFYEVLVSGALDDELFCVGGIQLIDIRKAVIMEKVDTALAEASLATRVTQRPAVMITDFVSS